MSWSQELDNLARHADNLHSLSVPTTSVSNDLLAILQVLYEKQNCRGTSMLHHKFTRYSLQVEDQDHESLWAQIKTNNKPTIKNIQIFFGKQRKSASKLQNNSEQLTNTDSERKNKTDQHLATYDPATTAIDVGKSLVKPNKGQTRTSRKADKKSNNSVVETMPVVANEDLEDWLNYMDNMAMADDDDQDVSGDLLFVREELYKSDNYDEDEDDDAEENKNVGYYKHDDFFGSNYDGVENNNDSDESDNDEQSEGNIDMDMYEDEDEGEDPDSNAEDSSYDEDSKHHENKDFVYNDQHAKIGDFSMPLAARRKNESLNEQISEMEKRLLQEKSWEFLGEVKATKRPENSLLELGADIERASKPVPLITQEFTSSIEDLVRRRILESNFDDVTFRTSELKKTAAGGNSAMYELSQEKSRSGLGEIYADAFLSHAAKSSGSGVSQQLEAARSTAMALFSKISGELDALSHFHFSPKPGLNDGSIETLATDGLHARSRFSAVQLEDVAPTSESAAAAFAPEEVMNKKRGRSAALLTTDELTSDDRRKTRRIRKARSKKDNNYSYSDAASRNNEEKLRRDSRVTLAKDAEHDASNKSSAFFSALQQQAQVQISAATKAVQHGRPPKQNDSTSSAIML